MPNEPQPQGVCELQGRQIEAQGLSALVLPVDARRWVLADNIALFKLLPFLTFLNQLYSNHYN
jgi:hypothetical protein